MQGSSDVNLKCIFPLQELDSDIIDLILMFADINICLSVAELEKEIKTHEINDL